MHFLNSEACQNVPYSLCNVEKSIDAAVIEQSTRSSSVSVTQPILFVHSIKQPGHTQAAEYSVLFVFQHFIHRSDLYPWIDFKFFKPLAHDRQLFSNWFFQTNLLHFVQTECCKLRLLTIVQTIASRSPSLSNELLLFVTICWAKNRLLFLTAFFSYRGGEFKWKLDPQFDNSISLASL